MLNFFRYRGEHREFYLFFKNMLGFTPRNTQLYQIAFIHKSKSLDMGKGRRVNFALSNTFGFGGHNATLAFRKI